MKQPSQPVLTVAQVASEVMQEVAAGSPAAAEALRRPDAVAAFQQARRLSSCLLQYPSTPACSSDLFSLLCATAIQPHGPRSSGGSC